MTLTELWEKRGASGDCPVMPVIQGWNLDDYLRCVELYEQHGVRLAEDHPVVGSGRSAAVRAPPKSARSSAPWPGSISRCTGSA
ncbi:hypothetical protein [Nonomuraea sp. NPDC046570]|uniref:deazapurine DNA modification protein DpdA family protein n=1 Tax=Nonomuraea sp. NPDC046570 TaxID=3155255 RepID=UPI0033F0D0BA